MTETQTQNEKHIKAAEANKNAEYRDLSRISTNRSLKPHVMKRSLIRGNNNGNGSFSGKNCKE